MVASTGLLLGWTFLPRFQLREESSSPAEEVESTPHSRPLVVCYGYADLEGGTFSVSNLGMMDAATFIAVINPPQAAILAVAASRKQFVPVDGQPVIRDLMTMTLSADHRIISGAAVARFLQEVKRLLQTPYSLLG